MQTRSYFICRVCVGTVEPSKQTESVHPIVNIVKILLARDEMSCMHYVASLHTTMSLMKPRSRTRFIRLSSSWFVLIYRMQRNSATENSLPDWHYHGRKRPILWSGSPILPLRPLFKLLVQSRASSEDRIFYGQCTLRATF